MAVFVNFKESLGNLFKRPATLPYPEEPRQYAERARGHICIDIDACIFCGMCQRKCPTHAITVTRAEGEWRIVRMHCIQCGACVESCPKKCLWLDPAPTAPAARPVEDVFRGEAPAPAVSREAGSQKDA